MVVHRCTQALLLASALVFSVNLTAQIPSFEMYSDPYRGGDTVAGDFNNDGKPDLIQCCIGDTYSFRAGNGDGTFQPPTTAFTSPTVNGASGFVSLTTADVNGDGQLDIVGTGPGSLYVFTGNGDGTFEGPTIYTTTNGADTIAVGNFFGNGHQDIAIGEGNSTIEMFRNDGYGNFALAGSISLTSGDNFVQVAAGDLNGNGVSDLAAAIGIEGNAAAYVLWNDGAGNFTQQELGPYPSYSMPRVQVARLNGDAQMDTIVSYDCGARAYDLCASFDVYYGQGNNNLFKRVAITDPNHQGDSGHVSMWGIDVNGDGIGDIVVSTAEACGCLFGVYVYLGNPDGSFQQTPQEFISSSIGSGVEALADFNRDGMMDFVAPAGIYSEIYINSTSRTSCGTYTINPTVTACQPVDNTFLPSPVTVQANSFDTNQVTAMQQYIDDQLVYTVELPSFTQSFDLNPGTHYLVTKAWDDTGLSFRANRTVTVYDGTPGPVCPAAIDSANICLPSANTSSSPVLILANGNSGTAVPTAAQLYIDGNLVINNQGCLPNTQCVGGTTYVQTTQNLPSGNHDLVFKLWDALGHVYTADKVITVQ